MANRSVPAATLLSALVLLAGCAADDESPAPSEPVAPVEPLEALVAFQASGTLTGFGGSTTPATPQGCDALQEEGVDVAHHEWEIVGDVNGTAADIVRMELTLTLVDEALIDADLYVEDADGDVLGQATAFNPLSGPSETVLVEDTLEPGTYTVIVRACSGRGAYEVTGEALLRTPVPEGAGDQTSTFTFSGTVTVGPRPAA